MTEPSDDDLDRLLTGAAAADDGVDDLAALVRDVRSAYTAVPGRAVEDRHVLPIVEAARAAGAGVAASPAKRSSKTPGGRRTLFGSAFASLWAKAAGVAAAATLATGSLAAAGALPDPAQTAVSRVAHHVGITLPVGDDQARKDAEAKEARKAAEKAAEEERKDAKDAGKGLDDVSGEGETATNAGDKSVSTDVHDALDEDYPTGRDKGAAVSDAADQNRRDGEHPKDDATPDSQGDEQKAGTGN